MTTPMENDPVPAYTATDDSGLFARIENLKESNSPIIAKLSFPITQHPERPQLYRGNEQLLPEDEYNVLSDAWFLCDNIIRSLFYAITTKHDELVSEFVSRGLVSPDVVSEKGETPLLAAVNVGDVNMVRTLVVLGATVDGFGRSSVYKYRDGDLTPLQLAAATGRLALVRFLMEDCGADDAIISPDGALALRLAAANGHREVVEYLPTRRGGAWLRWKTAHRRHMATALRAAKRIGRFVAIIVWYIPKWMVYEMPKEACKDMWRKRHRFWGWCKRTVRELPAKLKKVGKDMWEGAKKAPVEIWRAAKASTLWLFRLITAIPGALKIALKWIGSGLKKAWDAVAHIILRVLSFLHTLGVAVVSFFHDLTWQDVVNGFKSVLRAIFVGLPKAIWSFIADFGKMSYEMLKTLFGALGQLLWYIGLGLLWLVCYIPKKLWQILVSLVGSMSSGVREIMVWFDPKRM
ncbi:putative ankyrin repeat-containing protein [Phaeoacremonium minimum UCRPA7]|uniref:Putative ankyrin repeat-containing protein n=1 Tax=Phaeoacremonium minimum (strain UCR-PA7) TaxID=1286976 RepID=R8BN57_PHAM7|nr:putative ankyrin repeat-containing protein [Phaeoacremonium minimum UCRPA7]EOO00781.1 putative ankyrin repeat-containing protein [Phaeoacremonium minimum UCRPA7]